MRTVQIVLFALGVTAFLVSSLFTGQGLGDTLWRVGVAAMLVDLVCLRLWSGGRSV